MVCGSGFPAAIGTAGIKTIRGWKAAPTIKPTPKILKLTPMRRGGIEFPRRLNILFLAIWFAEHYYWSLQNGEVLIFFNHGRSL